MRRMGWALVGVFAALPVVCDATSPVSDPAAKVLATKPEKIGNGWAQVYLALDAKGSPAALGVSLDKAALEGLPHEPDLTSRCFDRNGDGRMQPDECIGDHNVTFAIPQVEAWATVSPFKWVALNWNPHGHGAPAPPPWAVPHFDFHFYIAARDEVKKLRPGRCGEMIDCDDFKLATRAVPAKYIHPDHIDVGAAVPDMGNHLIDSKTPELAPNGPAFTHTFIYGAYDGHITFLEPMITHAYLASKPTMCAPIKLPQAWAVAGAYPTRYCIRHLAAEDRYTVSIEGFVQRSAQ